MWTPRGGPRSPAAAKPSLAGEDRSKGPTYRIAGRVWAGSPAQLQLLEVPLQLRRRPQVAEEERSSSRRGNCGQVGAAPAARMTGGGRPRSRAVQGRWETRRPAGSEAQGHPRSVGFPRPGSFHGSKSSDRRERIDRAGRSGLVRRDRAPALERPARYRTGGGSGRELPPRFNWDRRPKADTDAGAMAPPGAHQSPRPRLLRSHRRWREVRSAVSELGLGPRRRDMVLVLVGGGATTWISNVASVRLVPGTGEVLSRPAVRSDAIQRLRVGGETPMAVSRSRYRKVSPEVSSSRRLSSMRSRPKGSRPRIWIQTRQWASR